MKFDINAIKEVFFIKKIKNNKNLKFCFFIILILIILKTNILKNIEAKVYFTEQKRLAKKVLDHSQDYKVRLSKYASIYYTESDVDYVDFIIRYINLYYPLLINDFEMNNKLLEKVKIIIYPTKEELEKAVNCKYFGKAPMGVYFGGVINIMSIDYFHEDGEFYSNIDFYLENGPLIHELTHYLLDKKSDGKFEIWFAEGLALFYEYKYLGFEWRNDLKNKSMSVSLEELKSNFKNIDTNIAYRRSFEIIKSYIDNFGEKDLQTKIKLF